MNKLNLFKYYKPSLGQSWLLVGLLFVGAIVVGIPLAGAPQSLTYFLMMLLPVAWCWWMGQRAFEAGGSPLAIDKPHFGKLHPAVFCLLAAVAMFALSVIIEPLTGVIPMPDFIKQAFEDAFVNSKLWDMILSTCIMAPLLEEFLCRGMMLRGMLQKKGPAKAILWSAFLFALMHMNPWQSIPAFLIGILLGWVYYRTHCLWATIFLHFFNNGMSTVISRLWPDLSIDAGWRDILQPTAYWCMYAASAVVLILILYFLYEKTIPSEVRTSPQA